MEKFEEFREDFYYDKNKSVFMLELPHPAFQEEMDAILNGDVSGAALRYLALLGRLYNQAKSNPQAQMQIINIVLVIKDPTVLEEHERRIRELLVAAIKAYNEGNSAEGDKNIEEVEDLTCSVSH
jgi:hypothetical protein